MTASPVPGGPPASRRHRSLPRKRPPSGTCGVCAIDLATGQVVALLRFETAVQEIFAVTVLLGKRYPDLINDDQKLLENSFVVPDAALADVPASPRGPAEPTCGAAGSGRNGSGPRVPFVTA